MNRLSGFFLLVATGLLFTACEDKQQTNLYKAQICIDNATPATADACLNDIAGQTSERAYVLRCSAAFISQGIDEDAIVAALENIDGSEEGVNPTTPTIAALAMADTTASRDALEVCSLTNSEVLTALASFSNMATGIKSLLGFTDGATAEDIETLLEDYKNNPGNYDDAKKEELGNTVLASQDSLCNPDDGYMKDDEACDDINTAVSNNPNDPTEIANELLNLIEED